MSLFVRSMFFVCLLMRNSGAFRYFWPNGDRRLTPNLATVPGGALPSG